MFEGYDERLGTTLGRFIPVGGWTLAGTLVDTARCDDCNDRQLRPNETQVHTVHRYSSTALVFSWNDVALSKSMTKRMILLE